MARFASWHTCEWTSLSGLLTLFRWQYEGPDLTPLTYHLNNSETTCSEIMFHVDFKSKSSAMNTFAVLQGEKKGGGRGRKENIFPNISTLFQPNRLWLM